MYQNPAPTSIDQSVIVEGAFFEGEHRHLGIALTPTCDVAQEKAEFVQFCGVFPAWDVLRGLLSSDWARLSSTDNYGRPAKRSDLKGKIKELARQRFPRWHWLAPIPGMSVPLLVDFQLVTSVALEDAEKLPIRAGLVSPFREQVAARYASYMGRVGTPDADPTELEAWAESSIDALFP